MSIILFQWQLHVFLSSTQHTFIQFFSCFSSLCFSFLCTFFKSISLVSSKIVCYTLNRISKVRHGLPFWEPFQVSSGLFPRLLSIFDSVCVCLRPSHTEIIFLKALICFLNLPSTLFFSPNGAKVFFIVTGTKHDMRLLYNS